VTRTKNSLVNTDPQKRRVFKGFCIPKRPIGAQEAIASSNPMPDMSRTNNFGQQSITQADHEKKHGADSRCLSVPNGGRMPS
jgi:hypothetical protein